MKSPENRKTFLETLVFTAPAVILVSVIIYIPFVLSGYYSLTEWNGIEKQPKFIGLENFRTLFSGSNSFTESLIFTGKYTLLSMVLLNVLALALAVALVKRMRSANVLRGVFFVPYIMSMTIVGFIWKFIFSQGFAKLYDSTRLSLFKLSWLGDPKLAFYSVVLVGVWQSIGFYMVLYIAGLQTIPRELLESAMVEGANSRVTFFRIVLPLLGSSITTCTFLSLINSLKVFDTILALTKGGPGGATYSVTLEIYREAFQNNNYGLGSAKSLVFFVIVLILTQIILKGFGKREVEL